MLRTPLDPNRLSETMVRVLKALLLREYRRNPEVYSNQPAVALSTLAQDIQAYASNVLPVWILAVHYDMTCNGLTAKQSLDGMARRANTGYSWRKVCYGGYKANRISYRGDS